MVKVKVFVHASNVDTDIDADNQKLKTDGRMTDDEQCMIK